MIDVGSTMDGIIWDYAVGHMLAMFDVHIYHVSVYYCWGTVVTIYLIYRQRYGKCMDSIYEFRNTRDKIDHNL